MNKKEILIPCPKRLPSEVGRDVANLIKYTQLKSRMKIIEDIKVFIEDIKRNPDPHVAFIVAEWGEGKTSLFEGYLKHLPRELGIVISIGGGTLVNYAKMIVDRKLLPKCEINGYKFLSSIFCSLHDEYKGSICNIKLPSPYYYEDAREYTIAVFKEVFNKGKNNKLFIFIDEFEEIVGADFETRRMIISGIVDFINAKVRELDQKEYKGRLHLIISLTPPAWSRLESDRSLAETMGRLGRRIKKIEIQRISKDEFYDFIHGVFKHMYESDKIEFYPFDPPELTNVIYISSMGNLGAIIRIIKELFNRACIESPQHGKMPILTFDRVLEYLQDIKVHLYGGETTVLFPERWKYLELTLREKLRSLRPESEDKWINVLKYFITVVAPTTLDQLSEQVCLDSDDVITAKDMFNQIFSKGGTLGIELGTLRCVYRVYHVIGKYDLVRALLRRRLSEILFQKEEREIDAIIEGLTFVNIKVEDGKVTYEPYLIFPNIYDENEFIDFIIEICEYLGIKISKEEAISLFNEIARMEKKGELKFDVSGYFLVSPKLISLLYQSPAITILDFVRDLKERLDLWRELLGKIEEKYLLPGVLSLLTIRGYAINSSSSYILEMPDPLIGGKIKVRILVRAIPQILTEGAIDELNDELDNLCKSKYPLPHVVIFFCEKIEERAKKGIKLIEDNYMTKVLVFTLPRVYMIQLAAIAKIFSRLRSSLAPEIIAQFAATGPDELSEYFKYTREVTFIDFERIRDILLRIGEMLELEKKLKEAIYSEYLFVREITDFKKIIGAYQYILIYPKTAASTKEIFEFAEEVRNLMLYSTKRGIFYTDIESVSEIEDCLKILEELGFLKKKEDIIEICISPIEERLLNLVALYGRSIDKKTLMENFIFAARKPGTIFDHYLRVLTWRNRISESKSVIELINPKEVSMNIKKKYCEFKKFVEEKSEIIEKFGYLCSGKIKDQRTICLSKYIEFVDRLAKSAEVESDVYVSLRMYSLLHWLINYYLSESSLMDITNCAFNEARKLYNQLNKELENIEEFEKTLVDNLEMISSSKIKIEINEICLLRKSANNFKLLFNSKLDCEEYREKMKEEWKRCKDKKEFDFYFRRGLKEAYYFNIKLRMLEQLYEDFKRNAEKINTEIEKALYKIRRIKSQQNILKKSLKSIKMDETLKISNRLLNLLEIPKIRSLVLEKVSTLNELNGKLNAHLKTLESIIDLVTNVSKEVGGIAELEREVITRAKRTDKYIRFAEILSKEVPIQDELMKRLSDSRLKHNEALNIYQDILKYVFSYKPIFILSHNMDTIDKLLSYVKKELSRTSESLEISEDYANAIPDYTINLLQKCSDELHFRLELYQKFEYKEKNLIIEINDFIRKLENVTKIIKNYEITREIYEISNILNKCEKLINKIISKLPLDEKEILILKEVRNILLSRKYQGLGFWDVVSYLRDRINKEEEYIVDRLLGLIKKRMLEVYFA